MTELKGEPKRWRPIRRRKKRIKTEDKDRRKVDR